jgi:hypothetical protein
MVESRGTVLRTVVRDCLYLNWAVPVDSLPPPPESLRYEEHDGGDRRVAFVSALLFRHERLHFAGLPFLKVSYPQFHLRLYVLDHEGIPSVLFHSLLVPRWVLPGARWLAGHPVLAGRFQYPRPSGEPNSEDWRWEVRREGSLKVSARPGAPTVSAGPSLGSWERLTAHFRQRQRGYIASFGRLRSVETSQRPVPIWPLQVSLEDLHLLEHRLPLTNVEQWPELHSAWLCPEIPFVFELDSVAAHRSRQRSTAPVAADPAMFRTSPSSSRRVAA